MSDFFDRLPNVPQDTLYTPPEYLEAVRDVENLHRGIKKAKVDRFDEDTKIRKKLAYCFTIIISVWLFFVISILYFNDFWLCINLSENVLITLLTTTTVNVLGMMYIILRNLFPKIK